MSVLLNACLIAAMSVDFGQNLRPIRPELHSSGFGPTICSQTQQDLDDVKAMGFKAARTHDWGGINWNQRCCDYFYIFPLMHLDAKDPKNYYFGPTDYLLKRTREEAGLEVFYRLGTSIEHSGGEVHFNATIPDEKDWDTLAETFAATVRHYNRGWADGYEWDIRYWEIWNEPEGIDNMWCPKEGVRGDDWKRESPKRVECREKFVRFFVKVLKRLKGEFGDSIKVGGPALCGYKEEWFRPILDACKAEGVAPDFISWHGYARDPMQFYREAETARKMLDSYGFDKCETIINEWHYFGATYSWSDMQRCSDPEVKARIWEGPDSHNGIRSAAFTLAALANLQRSKLDQAYYYGCAHVGSWGFKDSLQKKYKVFYALKLFGDLVRDYETVCDGSSTGALTTLAVRGKDGRNGLLVVDYGGPDLKLSVEVKGVPADSVPKVTVLDHQHDLTTLDPSRVTFKDGVLTIKKHDFFSAAFFIEFPARPMLK